MSNNIRELLAERAEEFGEKEFLVSATDDLRWSYVEFEKIVNSTAAFLRDQGIAKGDVVSLLLPNSPEYVIAYFACWQIGAIAGPINSLLKAEEIAWAVENSQSKLVLSEPHALAGGQLDAVRDRVPILTNWLPADSSTSDVPGIDIAPDDEAIIIYTSGTTGKPKGCLLTHGNLIANARQITEWMGFGPGDRLLTVMPLFHMNAVAVTTMTPLYAGGTSVVAPRFSASKFWDWIEKYKITSFGSVATMLSMLLERRHLAGDAETRNTVRFAMCGSAPVPAEVMKRFEETFGFLVIEGYGLSESTCRSTFNPPDERRRPGSCGMPIGNEMRVVDENDEDVPNGELGEIVLRGPNILKGYFNNPEATEKAFAGGWFHTGDIGYRDEDGFFYIADRKSDMIIRGGENIYPREIDDLLYTHPAVAAAAVIGVPDELYGEDVAAFIVLKDGYISSPPYEGGVDAASADGVVLSVANITPNDIIDFCKQHLADYKCPKKVYFLDEIPKGPTGKLLKRELARLINDR